ncbi:orotidine-5'-phosphate decarboxylase [Lichenihabitans sp. Uapishka_5]|uniref:orotidine-5'-phosphate decarboxylase n=1 Tax=Lichenihabitans sp. Uapishka_5 TaxID=3037302 RepID=UPI0029E7E3BE|nr:orotidine-5'-phosphate decarboxylase [Lichenihabitans sp. Uapishka_5]MDX7952326.1 orotidine-5'-phosphate decarboxylase [Lichenihabitans sp. Uapishka_5]
MTPDPRLIVALDLPSVEAAAAMVDRIGPAASFYKIGLELAFAGGLDLARRLVDKGHQVFLDFKLHDIPNTVTRATAQIANLGATFLTVHAYPQTMAAALAGRGSGGLQILGVSVLTSADDQDLAAAGYAEGAAALVARRAGQARDAGLQGLVLSPLELARVRSLVGPELRLVTPGIRPHGSQADDQKRTLAPGEAIAAGADYLVVGRPITGHADPRAAAAAIAAAMAHPA